MVFALDQAPAEIVYQACLHYEAVGRRSHVIERITSYQGHLGMPAGIRHSHIVRLHDAGAFHPVVIASSRCLKLNQVVFLDLAQIAKQRVAMAGDTGIPRRPGSAVPGMWPRATSSGSWPAPSRTTVRMLKARNRQPADRLSIWRSSTRFPGFGRGISARTTNPKSRWQSSPPALGRLPSIAAPYVF